MSKSNNGNTAGSDSTKGKYQPSEIDLRFLKAVDYVIGQNKAAKVKLSNDNAISKAFFSNRTIIGQIRSYRRGITMAQLQKFAGYFGLDFNYFFRGTEPMVYEPKEGGANGHVDIKGKHIKNVDIISGTKGNVHKGDVNSYSGHVGKLVERVDNITENTLNVMAHEGIATEENQDMQSIVQYYQERLRIVEEQRDQAKKKHMEISEKYIKLLEQKIGT